MFSKKELIIKYKKFINQNVSEWTKKEGIRIMTFNIQMFKNLDQRDSFDELECLIKESDSDIIFLYEALFFTTEQKKKFSEMKICSKYKYIKYCNNKYGINILLSKFPIVEHSILQLAKDPIKKMNRYCIIATIEINNQKIKLAGTHLDVFDNTEQTRFTQIEQILSNIDEEYILLGDFNSLRRKDYSNDEWNYIIDDSKKRNTDAHTLVTDIVEKNGFMECWDFCGKTSPKITVWSMKRVDYIYIGKKFNYKINNVETHFTCASDHLPLYLDIKIQ
jgi:endonuclease/exonuclease/phosphatase family metal-dependent hydrolase